MKVIYKDLGLKRIMKALGEVADAKLRVGLVGPAAQEPTADGRLTLAEAGVINEFGTDHIPARRFIRDTLTRGTVSQVENTVVQKLRAMLGPRDGAALKREIMTQVGVYLAGVIRGNILSQTVDVEGHSPFERNKASTIRKKGFDYPLVDTGSLAKAVSFEIVSAEQRMPSDVGPLGGALDVVAAAEGDI